MAYLLQLHTIYLLPAIELIITSTGNIGKFYHIVYQQRCKDETLQHAIQFQFDIFRCNFFLSVT